jgi:3-dehydroquinate synthase
VLAGPVLCELPQLIADTTRLVVVTDAKVRRLHAQSFPPGEVIEVGQGEGAKSLETLQDVFQQLQRFGLERDGMLLGVGGGLVCDVTGFAAATWLRGIRVGLVPTTLLAQADAAVGGKNGVNFGGIKNLLGTIRQPAFVLCDPVFLQTLSPAELSNGLAEVVKAAAVRDAALFGFLEANAEALLAFDSGALSHALFGALRVKLGVVERDECEEGERLVLNFGHTLGHAVEATLGLRHGEAVSLGMVFAARLSESRGWLPAGRAARLEQLLRRVQLPTRLAGNQAALLAAAHRDKKRIGNRLRMALLKEIGEAIVEPIEIGAFEAALSNLR